MLASTFRCERSLSGKDNSRLDMLPMLHRTASKRGSVVLIIQDSARLIDLSIRVERSDEFMQ